MEHIHEDFTQLWRDVLHEYFTYDINNLDRYFSSSFTRRTVGGGNTPIGVVCHKTLKKNKTTGNC
jgi:hypothetical protein